VDLLTRRLAEYATTLKMKDIPPEVIHEIKRLTLDSIACAIGGFHEDVSKISRQFARRVTTDYFPAHILGTNDACSPDLAAFANGTMIRALDYNDTVIPVGHPSDAMGAILAIADALHASGSILIPAITTTYEVFNALGSVANYQEIGWDQGWLIGLAATCGMANLLGFSVEQAAHAISISAVAHVSLRQTRAGHLSMWKGAAAPYAAGEAVRTTLLSRDGMTGPDRAFDGRHGVFEKLLGHFELPEPGKIGKPFHLFKTRMKYWPVEYYTQSVVWLSLKIRDWAPVAEIKSIDVEAHWACWSEVGNDPAKWDPQTRETADHSLPYIMAVTLRDGVITPSSFQKRAYLDPSLRPIMKKISVRENPVFTAALPDKTIIQIAVTNELGEKRTFSEEYPRGHRSNPMTDQEVEEKFIRLSEGLLGVGQIETFLKGCWALENEKDSALFLKNLIF
jgi:2-methylcitrate dehydratase